MRKQYYVGFRVQDHKLEIFNSANEPTSESHSDIYSAVIGPFRTKRAALWAEKYGRFNPHFQHVEDAERLSKLAA